MCRLSFFNFYNNIFTLGVLRNVWRIVDSFQCVTIIVPCVILLFQVVSVYIQSNAHVLF